MPTNNLPPSGPTREERNAYARAWMARFRRERPEEQAARKKADYQKHRDSVLRHQREYRQKNLSVIREKEKRKAQWHRDNNKKRRAEIQKRSKQKHKSRVSAAARNRRAIKRGASGSHTADDIRLMWHKQKKRCAMPNCRKPVSDRGKNVYHVDHIMPLVKHGSNNPDNLQLLCARCNLRKNAKHPDDWAKENGLLFI